MNVRKSKSNIEFLRDSEVVQTVFPYTTNNPTPDYRTIVEFTQPVNSYRLFTRIDLSSTDTVLVYFKIVRQNTILFEETYDPNRGATETFLASPESIRLDPGETISFQIKQSVSQQRDFYLNLAWINFPN